MKSERELRKELESSREDVEICRSFGNERDAEFALGWVKALEWVLGEHEFYDQGDWTVDEEASEE